MKKNKLMLVVLTAVLSTTCLASTSFTTKAAADTATAKQYTVSVLAGQDRYDTSSKIADEYIKNANNGVILALGDGFADALGGSVLAQKYKMPILLCDATSSESQAALSFIKSNVSTSKPIYILGGSGGIKDDVVNMLKSQGYSNITRLGGLDRYDTNSKIIDNFSAKEGTPVVIANGENFPDALSISSIAAAKGYPILLTTANSMSDEIKARLKAIKPSKIYIAGGTASVSDANLNEIKSLANLDSSNIVRLGGIDRYDTSLAIAKYFNSDSDTISFANGENFPDALSGSALSAQKGSPLVLVNNSDVSKQKQYVDSTKSTNLLFYGGDGVVSQSTRDTLSKAYNPSTQPVNTEDVIPDSGFKDDFVGKSFAQYDNPDATSITNEVIKNPNYDAQYGSGVVLKGGALYTKYGGKNLFTAVTDGWGLHGKSIVDMLGQFENNQMYETVNGFLATRKSNQVIDVGGADTRVIGVNVCATMFKFVTMEQDNDDIFAIGYRCLDNPSDPISNTQPVINFNNTYGSPEMVIVPEKLVDDQGNVNDDYADLLHQSLYGAFGKFYGDKVFPVLIQEAKARGNMTSWDTISTHNFGKLCMKFDPQNNLFAFHVSNN